MSLSPDQVVALVEAVFDWRLQEYISISFYTLYIYYVLTTLGEEVSIMFPQKWRQGKLLYICVRYGICISIALHLIRDYRNYYAISAKACKALAIIYDFSWFFSLLACDLVLGLCLSALLQARKHGFFSIMFLCAGPALVRLVVAVQSDIQASANPISPLDEELGYPCSVMRTDWGLKGSVQAYLYFATSCVVLVVVFATLITRYRGHRGRVIRVLRRDGGLYYVAVTVIRLALAILNTPAVMTTEDFLGSPMVMVFNTMRATVVPILAQRLMINMRKVDYVGTQPIASTLLFAPPKQGLKKPWEDRELDFFEMFPEPSTHTDRTITVHSTRS